MQETANLGPILHQENAKPIRIDESICMDFVYFRQLLRISRRADDNINHRINKIDVQNPDQCHVLWTEMKRLHQERQSTISFCTNVLKQKMLESESKKNILEKEVNLHSCPFNLAHFEK